MRTELAAVICILYITSASAYAQTASDIETKYGNPIKAYTVSENIWMTPEYTVEGQVCQMRLYHKRIASDSNYLSTRLPFEELLSVLNQLVPIEKRGTKKEPFGLTATGGGAAWTTYPYQKVTFIFLSSFKVDPGSWNQSKPYDLSAQNFPYNQRSENSSEGDFFRSQALAAEIVTIKWNDRRCAAK
jgi:hypothetical protein